MNINIIGYAVIYQDNTIVMTAPPKVGGASCLER